MSSLKNELTGFYRGADKSLARIDNSYVQIKRINCLSSPLKVTDSLQQACIVLSEQQISFQRHYQFRPTTLGSRSG